MGGLILGKYPGANGQRAKIAVLVFTIVETLCLMGLLTGPTDALT
jgi:hypothetical protein